MNYTFTIKNYRCFEDAEPLRFDLVRGLTAFVGPNNAGKSSILKFFYEFRNLWMMLGGLSGNITLVNALRHDGNWSAQLQGVQDELEVFCNENDRPIEIEITFPPTPSPSVRQSADRARIRVSRRQHTTFNVEVWAGTGSPLIIDHTAKFDGPILSTGGREFDLSQFIELFQSLSNTLYIGPFRNAINVGGANYFDIDIGTTFINTWAEWQTGASTEKNKAIQAVTENIQHVFAFTSLQITATKGMDNFQIAVNRQPYKLRELGSGLAQFIVVFASAAIKRPSFILIDEPELNLHPSLQLDFLTSLASYAKEGVLFATHSLGLARSAADRVYSVQQQDKKSLVKLFEQTPNLAEWLGELNFGSFRELGFDKILLVEGPTEIKTIQQFLRHLKIDHQVVVLHLGGSAMINGKREYELNEILRISPHVFALIDSERDGPSGPLSHGRRKFVDTCKKLGIKIHVLKRRATENYFSERAIQAAIPAAKGTKCKELTPYQKLDQHDPKWGKHENWRIARAMTLDEIRNTDLGKFLKKLA